MVSSPQHEPTMEEILASIRKIISEDSPEGQAAPVEAAAPAMDSDILDLTQEVVEEPAQAFQPEPEPMPEPEPQFMPEPEPAPVQAMAPLPENDVVFEEVEKPAPVAASAHSPSGIFSDKTRAAMDDAFAGLDADDEEDAAPVASTRGPKTAVDGATVEAVFERAVRESFNPVVKQWLGDNAPTIVEHMKPLIREWMDEHFPALLEMAVREEVARVAKARGSKR